MKTLVLGLGNPILSDDGIGIHVARALENVFDKEDITVTETSVGGLSLLDILIGYDRAIIIDAVQTVGGKVGQVYRLEPEVFADTRHAATPHDVNFATAMELGKQVGVALPRQIIIFAIEVKDVTTFNENCTPEVESAISHCVEMVRTVVENETVTEDCFSGL